MTKEIRSTEDLESVQTHLFRLQDWSDKRLMFHPDKCKVLQICSSSKRNLEQPIYFMRKSDGTVVHLEVSACEKDIGVYVNQHLIFDTHIETKVNKANCIKGIIRRSFTYLDEKMFRLLFKAMVRPHLEYAQSIWCPYLKKHIELIENVQGRLTELVLSLKNLPYEDRLRKLELLSVRFRSLKEK